MPRELHRQKLDSRQEILVQHFAQDMAPVNEIMDCLSGRVFRVNSDQHQTILHKQSTAKGAMRELIRELPCREEAFRQFLRALGRTSVFQSDPEFYFSVLQESPDPLRPELALDDDEIAWLRGMVATEENQSNMWPALLPQHLLVAVTVAGAFFMIGWWQAMRRR